MVALIEPGTNSCHPCIRSDLRVTKIFQHRGVRGQVAVTIANLLNGNAIQRYEQHVRDELAATDVHPARDASSSLSVTLTF